MISCFNPRPRAGGDQHFQRLIHTPSWFQSTPPRGGRLKRGAVCAHCLQFQSTPPRGGRHQAQVNSWMGITVSIHAPARGATGAVSWCARLWSVSIHAPARGATHQILSSSSNKLFQSTPPRGGRLWGSCGIFPPKEFQSTPPRGGRRCTVKPYS